MRSVNRCILYSIYSDLPTVCRVDMSKLEWSDLSRLCLEMTFACRRCELSIKFLVGERVETCDRRDPRGGGEVEYASEWCERTDF